MVVFLEVSFFPFVFNSNGLFFGPFVLLCHPIETVAHVNVVGCKDADPTRRLVRSMVLETKRHSFIIHFPRQNRLPIKFNHLTLSSNKKINNKDNELKKKLVNELRNILVWIRRLYTPAVGRN